MAQHCTNCGHELRGDEKFCAECGTPTAGGATQAPPTQYEYAQIDVESVRDFGFMLTSSIMAFYAVATSPTKGTYRVNHLVEWATDQSGQGRKYPDGSTALGKMVQIMAADGWELLPGKAQDGFGREAWYGHKFRRPVRS